MAVSRKAMTEGIRTFLFPGTPCERNLTIPQSKIRDFCQLPLHKGAGVLPHQLESHVGADALIGPLAKPDYM